VYSLLRGLQEDPGFRLQLVVTGAHLSESFGSTWREIERDGFQIDRKVDMRLTEDSPVGRARSVAVATAGLSEALEELEPDLLVLLGDRYEVLAAATAALMLGIPIAHLHGGEATEGLIDEAIRHAVTKMSHLHFVSAEPYRRRVIQLGEDPARVFTVGAFGLDAIDALDPLPRAELGRTVGLSLDGPFLLTTYHPVTLDPSEIEPSVGELLAALDALPDLKVVFTKANADPGGERVNELLAGYAQQNAGRAVLVANLGQRAYLSALSEAAVVVGNSSSGIIEAPAVGVPTVNLGERQRGRLQASSVINAPERRAAIVAAIRESLTDAARERVREVASPYGTGGAARRTLEVLRTYDLSGLLFKTFYDLPNAWAE
jgi:UDP-hydrolysing UDP-N-acetyl-D-glucosamine 2-epimerase